MNAHASSTPLNDSTETNALHQVFGEHAARVSVSGTKAFYGHALGASGAVEAAIASLSIARGWAPPTLNLVKPGEGCDLDYVDGDGRDQDIRTVLSQLLRLRRDQRIAGAASASRARGRPRMTAWLQTMPPELFLLPPLALAAGVDLYLTLLVLGAAPALGLWEAMPGALGDLDSLGVLLMVGTFYVLELLAEGWPSAALFWNAFHAIIRPLAGVLLALLLLDGQPLEIALPGALVAGALASAAHAARTGGGVLMWLDPSRHPSRILIALLEDVSVMGMIVLILDHPRVALGLAFAVVLLSLRLAGSQVRAFGFAVRLVWARAWRQLGQPRWDDPEQFPRWVRHALEGDIMAPGGGLRGSPAGAHRLPGAPRFADGWVVVRGDTPLFVWPRRRGAGRVDLGTLRATGVSESAFFRRVELLGSGGPAGLYFGLDGPVPGSLRAEFQTPRTFDDRSRNPLSRVG